MECFLSKVAGRSLAVVFLVQLLIFELFVCLFFLYIVLIFLDLDL